MKQDFTDDRVKLEAALMKLRTQPFGSRRNPADCPPMTYYEAYQIEQNDADAWKVARDEARGCLMGASQLAIESAIRSAARRAVVAGESELVSTLGNLESVVQRMSLVPGQRIITMMSPGFFVAPGVRDPSTLMDRAAKANVVINTIDARGLYNSRMYDASVVGSPGRDPAYSRFINSEDMIQNGVLCELSDATGGTCFRYRNDIDEGLLRAGTEPEVSYVLGFSPQNLKLDGKYHTLKVTLKSKTDWTVQARHGYLAPLASPDPEKAAYEEIDQELASQKQLRDIPIDCQTQVFKEANGSAQLTVVAGFETKDLNFRKVEDRNQDKVMMVIALFDSNGNFVSATERKIDLHLKDATLATLGKTGIRVKAEFDVKPGTLLVRVVAREAETGQMGTASQGVVVPD